MIEKKFQENATICLDLSNSISYKEKKNLIDLLAAKGLKISFLLNKSVSYLVKDKRDGVDSYKCRTAFKLGILVIHVEFFYQLFLSDNQQAKLEAYLINNKEDEIKFKNGFISTLVTKNALSQPSITIDFNKFKLFDSENDSKTDDFELDGYDVIKYAVFHELNGSNSFLYELQRSNNDNKFMNKNKFRLRVEKYSRKKSGKSSENETVSIKHVYAETGPILFDVFKHHATPYLNEKFYTFNLDLPSSRCGSKMLQKINLKSIVYKADQLDEDLVDFLNYIWNESIGNLDDILNLGDLNNVNSAYINISLEQLEKAELILYKQKLELNDLSKPKPTDYSNEFFVSLPFRSSFKNESIKSQRFLLKCFELCQVLRDIIMVGEETNWNLRASAQSIYRSIGTFVRKLDPSSYDYYSLENTIRNSFYFSNSHSNYNQLEIVSIYETTRPNELFNFNRVKLENVQMLFHGSRVENFLGILSRGLLLPKLQQSSNDLVIDLERTDIGMLGAGVYFSDSALTSLKYAHKSQSRSTRLIAICCVALGNCLDVYDYQLGINKPPDGYNSVHGVKRTSYVDSKFEDNEYCIYDLSQYKILYLAEVRLKPSDEVGSIKAPIRILLKNENMDEDKMKIDVDETLKNTKFIDDLEKLKENLEKSTKNGLMTNSNRALPLKSVHVRAKIVDLVAKVTIFQEYYNDELQLIEAQYLFPLNDQATVCNFEAFINEKHVIGLCKEKEQAHAEYREAVKAGKGAYLIDQETSDLFKVNIGNLPSSCKCVIKITYITELEVQNEEILFKLPSSISSWQILSYNSKLSNQVFDESSSENNTPITRFINKLNIDSSNSIKSTSFVASILMPFQIKSIKSPTHSIKLKNTACQAVLEVDKKLNAISDDDNLIIVINIATIHMPRMLVEDFFDPQEDKLTRACMVSFYPEFDTKSLGGPQSSSINLSFLLDCSNSMKESLSLLRKLTLYMLKYLPVDSFFNITLFGTDYLELFPYEVKSTEANVKKAYDFIQTNVNSTRGNTNLLNIFREKILLLDVKKSNFNYILISDGHMSSPNELFHTLATESNLNRVFTCNLGNKTNNSHLLKLISRLTGACSESFDSKYQSKWREKIIDLIDKVAQPPAVKDIKIEWQNFDDKNIYNVQAPSIINALFNGRRVVAYAFVENCKQATLRANINGYELSTVVQCPELCITRGDLIHKLAAKSLIDDWQSGILCESSKTENDFKRTSLKESIIILSTKYCITSEYTSFVAIEERKADEASEMAPKKQIDIQKLLKIDADSSSTDFLPYMVYDEPKLAVVIEKDEDEISDNFEQNLERLFRKIDYDLMSDSERNSLYSYLSGNKQKMLAQLRGTHPLKMKYILHLSEELKRLKRLKEAIQECKECLDGSVAELDCLNEESYLEAAKYMQKLRNEIEILSDNLEPKNLFVKTLSGKTINLDFNACSTVYGMKNMICDLNGTPPNQQRLIFAGRHLEESCSLADYNILKDSTIHLALRLRGGPPEPKIEKSELLQKNKKFNLLNSRNKEVNEEEEDKKEMSLDGLSSLEMVASELNYVKQIVDININKVLQRSESLETLRSEQDLAPTTEAFVRLFNNNNNINPLSDQADLLSNKRFSISQPTSPPPPPPPAAYAPLASQRKMTSPRQALMTGLSASINQRATDCLMPEEEDKEISLNLDKLSSPSYSIIDESLASDLKKSLLDQSLILDRFQQDYGSEAACQQQQQNSFVFGAFVPSGSRPSSPRQAGGSLGFDSGSCVSDDPSVKVALPLPLTLKIASKTNQPIPMKELSASDDVRATDYININSLLEKADLLSNTSERYIKEAKKIVNKKQEQQKSSSSSFSLSDSLPLRMKKGKHGAAWKISEDKDKNISHITNKYYDNSCSDDEQGSGGGGGLFLSNDCPPPVKKVNKLTNCQEMFEYISTNMIKIKTKTLSDADLFTEEVFGSLLSQNDEFFKFDTQFLNKLEFDLEPIIELLKQNGLDSLGKLQASEIENGIYNLLVCCLTTLLLEFSGKINLKEMEINTCSELKSFIIKNSVLIKKNFRPGLLKCLEYFESIQRKYPLACNTLEIARSWDHFIYSCFKAAIP